MERVSQTKEDDAFCMKCRHYLDQRFWTKKCEKCKHYPPLKPDNFEAKC